jgi:hypothetical protein
MHFGYVTVNPSYVPILQNLLRKKVQGLLLKPENKKKSCGSSPQANYTGRVTAICRRSLVPTFADSGLRMVSATNPHGH